MIQVSCAAFHYTVCLISFLFLSLVACRFWLILRIKYQRRTRPLCLTEAGPSRVRNYVHTASGCSLTLQYHPGDKGLFQSHFRNRAAPRLPEGRLRAAPAETIVLLWSQDTGHFLPMKPSNQEGISSWSTFSQTSPCSELRVPRRELFSCIPWKKKNVPQ